MLTLEELEALKPGVFASGTEALDGIHKIRWVAVRGFVPDWVIYIGERAMSYDFIRRFGTKLHDEIHILKLVQCDQEVMNAYRR